VTLEGSEQATTRLDLHRGAGDFTQLTVDHWQQLVPTFNGNKTLFVT